MDAGRGSESSENASVYMKEVTRLNDTADETLGCVSRVGVLLAEQTTALYTTPMLQDGKLWGQGMFWDGEI